MSTYIAPHAAVRASTDTERFDRVSILLHWAVLALMAAQFATAWTIDSVGPWKRSMIASHQSAGILVFLAMAARLVWRHTRAYLPPFPATMPQPWRLASTATEYALYAAVLSQPLFGIAITLGNKNPASIFGLMLPTPLAGNRAQHHMLHEIHELVAYGTLALIALHVTTVLLCRLLPRILPQRWGTAAGFNTATASVR